MASLSSLVARLCPCRAPPAAPVRAKTTSYRRNEALLIISNIDLKSRQGLDFIEALQRMAMIALVFATGLRPSSICTTDALDPSASAMAASDVSFDRAPGGWWAARIIVWHLKTNLSALDRQHQQFHLLPVQSVTSVPIEPSTRLLALLIAKGHYARKTLVRPSPRSTTCSLRQRPSWKALKVL